MNRVTAHKESRDTTRIVKLLDAPEQCYGFPFQGNDGDIRTKFQQIAVLEIFNNRYKLSYGLPTPQDYFLTFLRHWRTLTHGHHRNPIFSKQLISALSAEEYRLFQATLLERPDAGKVIPGGGGLRKMRWAAEGRGKSGGLRVIYYWFTGKGTILLLFIYPKNVLENLTPDQLKQLKKIVEDEYHER